MLFEAERNPRYGLSTKPASMCIERRRPTKTFADWSMTTKTLNAQTCAFLYTAHTYIVSLCGNEVWWQKSPEPKESEHFSTEEWSNLNIRAMEISCHSCLWYTLLCCVVLCCRNVLVRSILEKGKSINRHIWHDFVSISYRSYGWLIKWRTGHTLTQLQSPRKSYECMIYADRGREKEKEGRTRLKTKYVHSRWNWERVCVYVQCIKM